MNMPKRIQFHKMMTSDDGNPTGGYSHSCGLMIAWQDGPLNSTEHPSSALRESGQNGAFIEDVIAAAKTRLEFFQQSKFKSPYNARAINHLQAALDALNERSVERESRGVLGTFEV